MRGMAATAAAGNERKKNHTELKDQPAVDIFLMMFRSAAVPRDWVIKRQRHYNHTEDDRGVHEKHRDYPSSPRDGWECFDQKQIRDLISGKLSTERWLLKCFIFLRRFGR